MGAILGGDGLGRAAMDSLADGLYITDRERRIVYWNPAAERITGWTAAELVGTACFDNILLHEDLEGHPLCGSDTCPLYRAMVRDEPIRLPELVFARRRDGTRVPVEVTVAPLRDGGGRVVGGIETFRDLSPLLAELEQARLIQDHAMRSDDPPDPRLGVHLHHQPCSYVSGDFCRHERLGAMTRDEDDFAAAVFAALDLKPGTLRYANAGHPRLSDDPTLLGLRRAGRRRPGRRGCRPGRSRPCGPNPPAFNDALTTDPHPIDGCRVPSKPPRIRYPSRTASRPGVFGTAARKKRGCQQSVRVRYVSHDLVRKSCGVGTGGAGHDRADAGFRRLR